MVLLAAAAQVPMLGIGAWLLRHRGTTMARLAFLLGLVAFGMGLVVFLCLRTPPPEQLLAVVLLMALVGVVLMADAYRRWLTTDLD